MRPFPRNFGVCGLNRVALWALLIPPITFADTPQDPQQMDLRIYSSNRHGVTCHFLLVGSIEDAMSQVRSLDCRVETAESYKQRGDVQANRPAHLHSLHRKGVTCVFVNSGDDLHQLKCLPVVKREDFEENSSVDLKGRIHSAHRNGITCFYLGEGANAREISCFEETKGQYDARNAVSKQPQTKK